MTHMVVFWFTIATKLAVLLICLLICRKEYITRRQIDSASNFYQKRLNILSITALISILLWSMVNIIDVCTPILFIKIFFFHIHKILITIYQIGRLEYCFSVDQVHSQKYGYSKALFIFLFSNGLLMIMWTTCDMILKLSLPHWIIQDQYTCQVLTKYSNTEFHTKYFVPIAFTWFVLWDWFVLLLYVVKICQFYHKKSDENIPDSVIQRIKFILSKIILLTLLLQFFSGVSFWLYISRVRNLKIWFTVVGQLWIDIDAAITICLVYLMFVHNDKKYIKFIKLLNTVKVCICCRSCIKNALEYNDESQLAQSIERPTNKIDQTYTGYDHDLPKPIEIEMSEQSKI
eukprot:468131_1